MIIENWQHELREFFMIVQLYSLYVQCKVHQTYKAILLVSRNGMATHEVQTSRKCLLMVHRWHPSAFTINTPSWPSHHGVLSPAAVSYQSATLTHNHIKATLAGIDSHR